MLFLFTGRSKHIIATYCNIVVQHISSFTIWLQFHLALIDDVPQYGNTLSLVQILTFKYLYKNPSVNSSREIFHLSVIDNQMSISKSTAIYRRFIIMFFIIHPFYTCNVFQNSHAIADITKYSFKIMFDRISLIHNTIL